MQLLLTATADTWGMQAVRDLPALLADHAHCEKKAAAAAMALVSQYPEHPQLVRRMVALARQELAHFQAVHRHLLARGGNLGRDLGDPYVQQLLALVRHSRAERLLDRLLVSALVEARSCERLACIGTALMNADAPLAQFYAALAASEAGHARLFVRLAEGLCGKAATHLRLAVLQTQEAALVAALPVGPRVH